MPVLASLRDLLHNLYVNLQITNFTVFVVIKLFYVFFTFIQSCNQNSASYPWKRQFDSRHVS